MPADHFGRRYVELNGLRVYVGSQAECDGAAMVVCGNVSHFSDDVRGTCAGCGAPIVYRPHVPTRPPKLCIECAGFVIRADVGGTH